VRSIIKNQRRVFDESLINSLLVSTISYCDSVKKVI
jgi:hypothetical protein